MFDHVCKGSVIKKIIDHLIKFYPHRICSTFRSSFTRGCPTFKTGNRGKVSLSQPKNISDFTFFQRFYKAVSTAFTLQAFNNSIFG